MRRLRYLRAGARALGAALVLASSGCGPARFLSQVNDKAAGAVAAAKDANAATLAPYEFTAATEYLHKGREEGAYAEYQIAIEYGRRAEGLAERARTLAVERGGAAAPTEAAPSSTRPPASPEPPGHGKDSP